MGAVRGRWQVIYPIGGGRNTGACCAWGVQRPGHGFPGLNGQISRQGIDSEKEDRLSIEKAYVQEDGVVSYSMGMVRRG